MQHLQSNSRNRTKQDKSPALFKADRGSIVTSKGNLIPGTCEWIWSEADFESWRTGTKHLLWISGSPGKGKTFLSIYLVETLSGVRNKRAAGGDDLLILQYFCNNSENQRNAALAVVRGLLYQLLVAHEPLYDVILQAFESRQEAGKNLFTDAYIEELWRIFEKMVAMARRRVYFVLDGLDELDSKSINFLITKLKDTKCSIKTVVVSRPNLRLDLDQEDNRRTEQDVKLFVEIRVKEIPGVQKWQSDLERFLLGRAVGTFLWVWLAASRLKEHPEQTREILKAKASADAWLPKGLGAMYDRMLLDIRESDAEAAAAVLHHVALASRPLTKDELYYIVGDDADKIMQIDVSCRNLLTITGQAVQLVHLSLKEHLVHVPKRDLLASATRFLRPSLLPILRPLLLSNKLYLADRMSSALLISLPVMLSVWRDARRHTKRFSGLGVAAVSFCYMLLPTRRTLMVCVFGIDERKVHGEFLQRCLEFMEKLEKNGCKLDSLAAAVDKAKINSYLPSHVQYACLSYVYHLKKSQARVRDDDRVHRFLQLHFLHWLEALSLMERMSESISLIRDLQTLLEPRASTRAPSYLADAARFVQANLAIINGAPLQIYSSALVFAPKKSVIKKTFWGAISLRFSILPQVESD